jgi:hypothetical protein
LSNPSKDPQFNDALKRMIASPPKQNKDLKLGSKPSTKPKEPKKAKPWAWARK